MFSNIFQKAALLGASTVASVALTGMMASSAQAATMSYTSNFSVISNSLDSEVAAGEFSFDKTELTGKDAGSFSYKLEGFNTTFDESFYQNLNAPLNALGINQSFTLNDIKENPAPLFVLNQMFVPQKYQNILTSVLAGDDSNYVGDGDFLTDNFTYEFGENFVNQLTPLLSLFLENEAQTQEVAGFLDDTLGEGVQVKFTTTLVSQSSSNLASVPEPTSILGIGIIGVGLTATRRKRATKKIKQKSAA